MALMHRTVYHSSAGEAFARVARRSFYGWLQSRDQSIDISRVGKHGRYQELGKNFRAREDSVETDGSKSFRYSQIVTNEHGTYSSQLTVVEKQGMALAQLDVHAPREDAQFSSPALARTLIERASAKRITVSSLDGSSLFTPSFRVCRADKVGELLDRVIENPDRDTTTLLVGTSPSWGVARTQEIFEPFVSKSVGVANLWLMDPEATEEFNMMVQEEYQVYPSTIRAFQPGVDTQKRGDALRHRYIPQKDLFGANYRSTASISAKLYHLSRLTPLRQPLPDLLKQADRDLTEHVHRLRLQGEERQPVRELLRGNIAAKPKSEPDVTERHPLRVKTPGEESTTSTRFLAERPRLSPPLSPRPAPQPIETKEPVPAPKTEALTEKIDSSPELQKAQEQVSVLRETLLDVAELLAIPTRDSVDLESLVYEIADVADGAEKRLRETEEYANELQADNQRLAGVKDTDDNQMSYLFEEIDRYEQMETRLLEENQHLRLSLQKLNAPLGAYTVAPLDEPTSMSELLERLAKGNWNVKFTGNEKKAIALDQRPTSSQIAGLAWRVVQTLQSYSELPPEKREGMEAFIDKGIFGVAPNKFSPTETKSVRENENFNRQRYLPVPETVSPNKRVYMYPHFKLAYDGGKQPRLHYFDALDIDGCFYIGYIGEHLSSRMTT